MEREFSTDNELSRTQEQIEAEIDAQVAAGTYVNEYAPTVFTVRCHEEVYKTLATAGDFPCRVYYREEELDTDREQGVRSVVVLTSEEYLDPIEDPTGDFQAWFSKPGTVFVNAICRCPSEGQTITSTRDCRDCVKWLANQSFLSQFNGNKDKIYVVDEDGAIVHMNYDLSSASMTVNEPLAFDVWDVDTEFPPNSDVSREDLGYPAIGNGSVSLSYTRVFQSGSISINALKSAFGGGNSINDYYRGGNAIVNISENNSVPTSGTISFGNFRNTTNSIQANCDGNFRHLNIRHEVFGATIWSTKLKKTVRFSGHAGSESHGNPALRFANSGEGVIELVYAGTPGVYGLPGNGGGGGGGGGQGGGLAIHLASPTKISGGVWGSIAAGGGGGLGIKG